MVSYESLEGSRREATNDGRHRLVIFTVNNDGTGVAAVRVDAIFIGQGLLGFLIGGIPDQS